MKTVSISELEEYLRYDELTGELFWIKQPSTKIKIGSKAGSLSANKKYLRVGFKGKQYYLHRVVWALYYKEWPTKAIDHRDQNPFNNTISNLRSCNYQENNRNKSSDKDAVSSFKGVYWHKGGKKWNAAAKVDGKQVHLGVFNTELEAAAAYDNFAQKHYGEFAHLNLTGVVSA